MAEMGVTLANIEAAERVLGVSYTGAERALMLDNLEGQITAAIARRSVQLPNSAQPALRFDPRLPGFSMPSTQGSLTFSSPTAQALPQDDDDIAFAPATQLSHWIASGQITSRRLTEIYLARIDRYDPELECLATVTRELALAEADAADALTRAGVSLGPLHGIPYVLKDLFDTKGVVTGWGAEPYRDRVPDSDAAIVAKLRQAGAVLLGKSALGALAYNDVWYGGFTRNPWNLNEGSSGSSAGSASATAAGLCGFSIGTETLGSITSPSQRCGTTGLRPTFGRVSRIGGMALCWSLDKIGAICRSVEDNAMVLAAINGYDPADRGSIDAPFIFDATAELAGMRLGYLPEEFGPDADAVDRHVLDVAGRLGVELVPVSLPDLPYHALLNILYAEAAASFEDLTLDDTDDTLTLQSAGAWPNIFRKSRFLSAVDHVQLDRLRYQVMVALDTVFGTVDAMIGPFSMAGPMLVASNFTGHPCLHMRAGFSELPTRLPMSFGTRAAPADAVPEDAPTFRVPQGISLWGKLFEEGPILSLGMALERELGIADIRPTFAR